MTIFKDHIFSLNDIISKDLKKVVSQVSPPGGKVVYVSKGDKKVIQIHQLAPVGEPVEVQFKYFVSQNELDIVQEMFFVSAPALIPVEAEGKFKETSEEIEEEEDATQGSDDDEDDTDGGESDDKEAPESDYHETSASEKPALNRQSSTSTTKYF